MATKSVSPKNALMLLNKLYPSEGTGLKFKSHFQLLVSIVLSAQMTDVGVNRVTLELFRKYPNSEKLAKAKTSDVERIIKSINYYKTKSRNIIALAKMIQADYCGKIPRSIKELIKLPGVGRKTANVLLANAYDISEGIAVDTHVTRLSRRLGFTKSDDPKKIENDLMKIFPKSSWLHLSNQLIAHGRSICTAKKPLCEVCVFGKNCPSYKGKTRK